MSKDRSFSTAIHILAMLAYRHPDQLSSETMAIGLRTNPGLVRRTLLKLSAKGLIATSKGKGGGSQLAKPPSKISLEDIYLAVKEGPIFGSFDKEPFELCKVSCSMGSVLANIYDELEQDMMVKMRKIKLTKVISDIG